MPQASRTHIQRPRARVTQLGRRLERSHAPCSQTRTQGGTGKGKARRAQAGTGASDSLDQSVCQCFLPLAHFFLASSPSQKELYPTDLSLACPVVLGIKVLLGVGVSLGHRTPVASSCADRPPTLVLHDKWPGPSLFPQVNHGSARSLESSSWCSVLRPKQSLRDVSDSQR